jgi:hemerythrin-like domain-containing protein
MTGQVAHLLDEEHQATLALLAAAEGAFGRSRADALRDEGLVRIALRLRAHLVEHVPRHFAFEEDALFPRLADAGEGDICELLRDEHREIESVIAEIVPLATDVAALDAPGFDVLRRAVLELCERLRAHIEKETMGLVPLCDDHLAAGTDGELALAYASS